MLDYLARALWWNVGANIIQWSTIITWSLVFYTYWHHRCHSAFCVRPGQVPIKGTHTKVCKRHAVKHGHTH